MAGGIFDKQATLKPTAMATVAERRFADAEALIHTGSNAHANGAAYLAGFVIEILLKAQLVKTYPRTARKRQHEVAASEREVWSLIWRQHDLEGMLARLEHVEAALQARGLVDGRGYLENLRKLCATWTIHARYSPRTMLLAEASSMVDRVREIKELLK